MSGSGVATGSLRGEAQWREPERWERTVARRSAEIRAIVPSVEYTTMLSVGGAEALAAREGLSLDALLLGAAARALRAVPEANGAYLDGGYVLYPRVNLGVVMTPPGRYSIATLFDADTRPGSELSNELEELRRRAAEGELSPAEQSGATFTVAFAPGASVVRHAPLIISPQSAALAVGSVQDAPMVSEGVVVAGRVLELTLAADARIVFPPHAGAFLDEMGRELGGMR